ncbi:Acyltransferase family protein [Marinomonas aquimarina]|uniref:Acyltransferase family protein n=1 Tax=Marinomonas aquimarina TaxID=295068 RepID=A0A1A8TJ41_9GAMM|nr:acyltransferase family protein [Marinomonas aquimarina]SBS33440.1 Acyltransferase family protein [Marinomonas aquimarina]
MARSVLLDLLRIMAISLVFVAHFGQVLDHWTGEFFGIKNFYYVSLGGVGVSMFLVLSGVLAGLTDLPKNTPFFRYLGKKILRIYPLYWLSIPVVIVAYLLEGLMMEGEWRQVFPNGFVTDVLGSLTGFYAWFGLWGGPYNPPSWFIALIITLYAVFPLLAFSMRRWPNPTLVVLLLISVLSRWYVGQYGVPFVPSNWLDDVESWAYRLYGFMPGRPGDWFILCRIFEFGLGIWLALKLRTTSWAVLNGLPNWLKQPIAFLSDLSFALFLIHVPFLFLLTWLMELGVNVMVAITLVFAITLALAYQLQRLDSKMPRKRWFYKGS